ncbi:MAG: hypothetical protein LBN19_01450 [Endomicrobium sp.]|jgi:hypothetical protein|nr:hypothetical protein [Endomicrobium sp.]
MNKKIECKYICFGMCGCFFAIIVFLVILFVYICFSGHKELLNSCIVKLASLTDNSIPTHQVSQDAFLSTITDFYTSIISFLTIIIAVISALAFIYIRHVSKREMRIEIEESLREKSFQLLLSKTINEHPDITDVIEKYGNFPKEVDSFNKRIEFLEKLADTKNSDILK